MPNKPISSMAIMAVSTGITRWDRPPFIAQKLRQNPNWNINIEIEPESWEVVRQRDPEGYEAFKRLFKDQSVESGRIEYVNPTYAQSYFFGTSGESAIRQFEYGLQKGGRKVAGILAEALIEHNAVVLGIGVDLFPAQSAVLPTDQPITTLLANQPDSYPRPELAGRFLTNLMRLFANPETIMPIYRAKAAWVGRRITVSGTQNPLTGTISGFDDNGALLLQTAQGTMVVTSGTIRLAD